MGVSKQNPRTIGLWRNISPSMLQIPSRTALKSTSSKAAVESSGRQLTNGMLTSLQLIISISSLFSLISRFTNSYSTTIRFRRQVNHSRRRGARWYKDRHARLCATTIHSDGKGDAMSDGELE